MSDQIEAMLQRQFTDCILLSHAISGGRGPTCWLLYTPGDAPFVRVEGLTEYQICADGTTGKYDIWTHDAQGHLTIAQGGLDRGQVLQIFRPQQVDDGGGQNRRVRRRQH